MKIYFTSIFIIVLACIKTDAAELNSSSFPPPPPVITGQPQSQSVCVSYDCSFLVSLSDYTNATFQWQEDRGAGFKNIVKGFGYANIDSARLLLGKITTTMSGYQYRCIVTNSSGTVTTSSATLTIIVTVVITQQPPANTSVCFGENATMCFTANANNPTYQWRWSVASGWADLHDGGYYGGTNSACIKLTNVSNAKPPAGTYIFYQCIITSGGCSLTTGLAALTIKTIPPINTQPINDSICLGNNSTFLVASQGSGLTYKWQEDKGSGFANLTEGGIYSGSTNKQVIITAVTQPMSGYKYRCGVTNSCGTVTSNSATLVVNTIPVITSQPPSSVTVCNGGTISFGPHVTGTNLNYQWQATTGSGFFELPNSSFYVNAKTPTLKLSAISNQPPPAGIYTLYKSKIYAAGCPVVYSNNVNVTITPSVPASVSISTSSLVTCPGIPVNFTASPINGGGKPAYQWRLNGGLIGTNSRTFSSSTLINGDKVTCTMISNDSCSVGSPVTSDPIQISVVANPPASVTVSASANTICAGQKIDFTAVAGNGGNTPAFQWKLNNQTTGTNSPFYSNSNLKNGDSVKCIMTSSASCVTGSPVTSKAKIISVVQNVSASVEISASDTAVCKGTVVSFTSTPVNGGLKPAYQWKINGQNFGNDSSVVSYDHWNEGDLVTVVMTSNSNCVTGPPVVSKPKKIHLKALSFASVSINTASTSVCEGSTTIFTANPVFGGNTPTYKWRVNRKNAGQNLRIFSADNLKGGDTVSVVMFSSDCVSNDSALSNTLVLLKGIAATAGTIHSNKNDICAGQAAALSVTGNSAGVQWQSSPNSSGFKDIQGATSANYTTQSLNNTRFYRVVVGNGSCSDTSNIVRVNVFSPLSAEFVWNIESKDVFFNSGISSGDIVKYEWTFGDGGTDTLPFPVHTYKKDTIYRVCLIVYDSSDCNFIRCWNIDLRETEISVISKQSHMKIYPNPFGKLLFINQESQEQIESVEIFDLIGRRVMGKDFSNSSEKTLMLDVSAISNGMYYLKIKTSNDLYVHAVIKQ